MRRIMDSLVAARVWLKPRCMVALLICWRTTLGAKRMHENSNGRHLGTWSSLNTTTDEVPRRKGGKRRGGGGRQLSNGTGSAGC